MNMERWMFRKIELWIVGLILIGALVGAIAFGAIVKDEVEARQSQNRSAHFGPIGKMAYRLAALPGTLQKLAMETEPLKAMDKGHAATQGGWTQHADLASQTGFLLLSRYDADRAEAAIELVRLSDLSVQYRWTADPAILFEGASRSLKTTDYTQWQPSRFRVMHPLLEADGSILLHGQQSPLVRLGACGDQLMISDAIHSHHSLNMDADGQIWAPVVLEAVHGGRAVNYEDDALASFSADGTLSFTRSVPDLLEDAGLTHLVFAAYNLHRSIVHLNDIEPVLKDGPYWKKGDLFVSLRRQSMIFLYRPSVDKIVWMKQGPWLAQHDVDVLDDHRIAVFNNNMIDRGQGVEANGHSEIVVYDFATDQVDRPFDVAMAREGVAAESNGLFDLTATGDAIVEEDTAGRILLIGKDQKLLAEFTNRAGNGQLYRMGWSRYVPQELGDRALAALAGKTCPP